MEEKTHSARHIREGFIDTSHSWVIAKVLLQACSRTPGCPWSNPGGDGETQRDLWLQQQMVMWGYRGGCTWQCQSNPGRVAPSLWVNLHPDLPVPPIQQSPVFGPHARELSLAAGADPLRGVPTHQRNLEHQQQPGSEQQCLQGRAKRLAWWNGL